jgi:hypothetical protein
VWLQPAWVWEADRLISAKSNPWWVANSKAYEGDLLLTYYALPRGCIGHTYRIVTKPQLRKRPSRSPTTMTRIKQICALHAPLHLSQLRGHRVLKSAGFVRARMQGRPRGTAYWPDIYRQIIDTNPTLETALRPYEPGRRARSR